MRATLVIAMGAAYALAIGAVGCGGILYVPEPEQGDDPPESGPAGGDEDTATGGGGAADDPGAGDADPDTGNDDACDAGTVAICHVPPGDPSDAHVICVSAEAAEALLEHGDRLGSCETEPPEDPGNDPGDDPGTGPGTDPAEEEPAQACGKHDGKLLICHSVGDSEAAARTICVGSPAAEAHLDHGDAPGVCQ